MLKSAMWSAVAGGTLAGLSLSLPALAVLAPVGVALFLLSCRRAASSLQALLIGLVFGLLASAGGIWWFWDVIPLSWISVPAGPVQFFLVAVVFFLTSLSLALPFSFVAPLVRKLPDAVLFQVLGAAALYVVAEEIRPWSFALFFLGPESTLSPHFSIASLGYTLTGNPATLPLAQLGILGLEVGVGYLAALLMLFAQAPRRWKPLAGYGLVGLSILAGAYASLPRENTGGDTETVALVASYLPPGPFTKPDAIMQLMFQGASRHPDIIVTPEGFGLSRFFNEDLRHSFYQYVFAGREGLVISSSVVTDAGGNERAELSYESSSAGVVGTQEKIFFVPVGEYLPPLLRAAISLAGKDNLHGYGEYLRGRAIPGSTLSPGSWSGISIGGLLCSEMLSGNLYHALATQGHTDMLVNLANNSWFHGSHLLHERLKGLAKVHALEERQYMLVAANGSPAYAIDPRGTLVGETVWDQPDVLVVQVPRP